MRRVLVALVLVCFLPATGAGVAVTDGTNAGQQPAIVAAYPNPIADGDAGEYVLVSLPAAVDPDAYVVTDGESTVSLANASAGTRVAVANDPRARNLTDAPLVVAPSLSLANGGEAVRVERNGTVVDERRYRDAPGGEIATWNGSRIRWRQVGATDRPVVRADGGHVRTFVLPDSPSAPVETLRRADSRILLGGYTLTSERVVDALASARERDVTVRVLLEGEPVGGRTQREARRLERLASAGVDLRLVSGEHARYRYHHAWSPKPNVDGVDNPQADLMPGLVCI